MRMQSVKEISKQEEIEMFRELFFTKLDCAQQDLQFFARLLKGISKEIVDGLIEKWFFEVAADAAIESGISREVFLRLMGDVYDEMTAERAGTNEEEDEEEEQSPDTAPEGVAT